ncbi:MAG: oligosaccharide flippase family protein [Candidatus Limnocylindrales bacterium]
MGAFAWSAGGDAAAKVAVLLVNLLAARMLLPERFAVYVGLLAGAYVAAAAWDAGIATLVNAERSRFRAPLRSLSRRVAQTRILTFPAWILVYAVATLVIGRAAGVDLPEVAPFVVVSLAASLQQPVVAALRADLRFRDATACVIAGRWATVAVIAAALLANTGGGGIALLGVAYAAGELVVLAFGVERLVRHAHRAEDRTWDPARISVRAALPYAANGLLSIAYNRLDVILVAALTTASQLAAYAPASRIQDALYILPTAIASLSLPYLSRLADHEDATSEMTRMMRRLWALGLAFAVPLAFILIAFMPEAISAVLGSEYELAVGPSRILVWSMPLAVIGGPLLAYLIAVGRGVETTIAFAVAFVVSVTLHLSLDWWLGATGAAIASLARDGANVAVAAWLVWRLMPGRRNDSASAGGGPRQEAQASTSRTSLP